MTVFDCPECDHRSTHWSVLTGMFTVFLHFWREHPHETPTQDEFRTNRGDE